ncbi:hypothetical protein CcrC1_gp119 [Caulobacter phage C1]|nr:hypothetical protein CcrC1_gp119 [Caulobacter phage C1]UTU08866.1 hypothetical protein CcrJ4_gp115 [Caulobacter phage J4]UTU09981.1 hypothetical protein CcrRB23_gp119 [Caulobacter phage RB23]WGN97533.1 hypothetical protein [Bertelyvirus sp.]
MARLSKDQSAGTLHPRENYVANGTLGSVNAEIVLETHGNSIVTLDLRGTFNLTVELQGSVDLINWVALPTLPLMENSGLLMNIAGSTPGSWMARCAGFQRLKAKVTGYTSGAATATMVASTAPFGLGAEPTTPNIVTATGSAGAAVTLTLPTAAPLTHHITFISITRFAAIALTANGAPSIVTTTNLPGGLAYSLPREAAALGTAFSMREDYSNALRASDVGPTTIVLPATTGVIWRVTVGYYNAP